MSNGKIITKVRDVSVLAAGFIGVKLERILRMADHDERIGGRYYQLRPGDPLDGQPEEVQRLARACWTVEAPSH
ncbi:hypothetical protein [Zavarzinia sp.]|uniref:hypothetical protein n=1 Tax=Zavarzinia sp. TaxID=2027920 RepID=UPI003563DF1D